MPAIRRLLSTAALALTAGSALATGLPSGAGATTNARVPQYIIRFSAIVLPATPAWLRFHSTSCAIGPAVDPIVVTCQENGTIRFTAAGGSGTASVSSVLAGINWKFTLVRATPTTNTYRMVGRGTESRGASPVLLPVKVTGTLKVEPTPDPTIKGSESVYPLPTPVS
jgi:hypothetical protein